MEKRSYFAKFDGVDIEGKVYGLGDEITDVHPAVLQVLVDQGRISSDRPVTGATVPIENRKDVGTMTRAELVSELTQHLTNDATASDDDLRHMVDRARSMADEGNDDDDDDGDERLDAKAEDVITTVNAIEDRDDLERLRAGEGKRRRPRSTVTAAIDARIAALG